jgi:hypothetical protein
MLLDSFSRSILRITNLICSIIYKRRTSQSQSFGSPAKMPELAQPALPSVGAGDGGQELTMRCPNSQNKSDMNLGILNIFKITY